MLPLIEPLKFELEGLPPMINPVDNVDATPPLLMTDIPDPNERRF
jgi:hypothetical protein